MRGTGEGHYPWDLQPKSIMTNASVEQVVTAVNGPTLMVKYKDGEKTIIVPPDAPVVTFAPGDKACGQPCATRLVDQFAAGHAQCREDAGECHGRRSGRESVILHGTLNNELTFKEFLRRTAFRNDQFGQSRAGA